MEIAAEAPGQRQNERRHEILSVARTLLLTQGYARTSMRNIASQLNVTPTTLYLYFRNKDDLIFQLMEEAFAPLWEDLQRVTEETGEPVANLRRGLEIFVRFGLEHPDPFQVVFLRPAGDGRGEALLAEDETALLRGRACGYLRALVQACIDAGCFGRSDGAAVAEMICASVEGGIAWSLRQRPQDIPAEALAALQVETLIRGLMLKN